MSKACNFFKTNILILVADFVFQCHCVLLIKNGDFHKSNEICGSITFELQIYVNRILFSFANGCLGLQFALISIAIDICSMHGCFG